MRAAIAATLFAVVALVAVAEPADILAQDKKDEKKAQPKFDPPKAIQPDEATLKTIAEKTEELRKAVAALKEKKITDGVLVDVEIYLKAAENIVRFEEWYSKDSSKWALATLDQGLARAKQAEGGKAVWRNAPGKWVVRAYRSNVDYSIQPYAVLLPHDYKVPWTKPRRVDVVLHGRDSALTEAKFIATHNGAAPKDLGFIQLEVYGRGNNAYRWAGETDVYEAMDDFWGRVEFKPPGKDEAQPPPPWFVLRGFSMGGAGTWHIGLHRPGLFNVIGPGAGFTTTHGYVGNLPEVLPDYQEKCLRIYDAVDYAENAFNVPIVAYSGEKDAQKKAADNIENALKGFKEPVKFTHLVAPGLEHQMPREWQEKAEAEYRKYCDKPRDRSPARVRCVTYTPQYGSCDWIKIYALEQTYAKAVVDATRTGDAYEVKTTNIQRFDLYESDRVPTAITIDGQEIKPVPAEGGAVFDKQDGKWVAITYGKHFLWSTYPPHKQAHQQGPIDDAFTSDFVVVKPTGAGFSQGTDRYTTAAADRFADVWDKYFRGKLDFLSADKVKLRDNHYDPTLVLFGDPLSNPVIAKVLPKLPIIWTKDKLLVNGVEYDSKTHVPVLIYPNPMNPRKCVVLNSGHTFKESDLKGTNALLYPRLGDWAVIKPTPTDKDPAAYEVVAAGLFDDNWQFPKKK